MSLSNWIDPKDKLPDHREMVWVVHDVSNSYYAQKKYEKAYDTTLAECVGEEFVTISFQSSCCTDDGDTIDNVLLWQPFCIPDRPDYLKDIEIEGWKCKYNIKNDFRSNRLGYCKDVKQFENPKLQNECTGWCKENKK